MTNLPKDGICLLLHDNKFVTLPPSSNEGKRTNVQKHDILISITAELGKIGFVEDDLGEAYVNQHVALVRVSSPKASPKFIAHYLAAAPQRKLLQCLNDAGAKAGLNLQTINKFPVILPPISEQTVIASLLSTWDLAIEKTERLIAAKEKRFTALTQELIHNCTEGLRHVHLRDICEPVTRKNSINELNVLTTSAQHGLISQMDYYKKSVSAEDVSGYYLLKNGEFAYNRSSSNGYPYGAIKRLDGYPQGVLSTLYLCFSLKSTAPCDSNFMAHAFEAGLLNKQLVGVCQEGARSHGLLNITKTDFFGLTMALPAISEQRKIAVILTTARQEIDLLKKQAEAYRRQKRGLMQRLLAGEWRVKVNEVVQ
jgi:type I restriction enzyme S subunit